MLHPSAVFCPSELREDVFPPSILQQIEERTALQIEPIEPDRWQDHATSLRPVEVLFTTWGTQPLDADFLDALPRLKAVFYCAGAVKSFVTEVMWARNISLSSAWVANGVPVSEFTVAAVLLSLKRFWHFARGTREGLWREEIPVPGAFHSRVGLVSLGAVGRLTAERLRAHEVDLFAFDPFVATETAAQLGVSLLSLEELFATCDVVSLHAPWIKETERLITGALIASMKEGATLINTSRGAVVAEDELIHVLKARPDLSALLDVTYPEPPALDSPLRSLPNVLLTPHIAGSMQAECARLSQWMIEEYDRYRAGRPLLFSIQRDQLARMA